MKICPNCQAENAFDGAQFCKKCGTYLREQKLQTNGHVAIEDKAAAEDKDDDLDFVVTETKGPSSPNFLDLSQKDEKKEEGERTERIDDVENQELEIATTADLLNDGTFDPIPPPPEPPPPPKNEFDFGELAGEKFENNEPAAPKTEEGKPEIPPVDWNTDVPVDSRELRQIAAKSIEASAQSNEADYPPIPSFSEEHDYQTDTESTMAAGTVRPAADPAKSVNIPKSGQKIRGVAYFRKNIIQVVGNPFLHDGDELVINNKHYLLRTKTLGRKAAIGIFAGLVAVVLIIVALQFMNSPLSGDGSMVGLILNEYSQPYLEGARVTILPLNKTTRTNAQGFFRFDMIPTGTYEIVYELGDKYIGRGNSTITAGQTTLMTFKDLEPMALAEKKNVEQALTGSDKSRTDKTASSSNNAATASTSQDNSGYGKLKLEANVDGARFMVDGKVLGAGNNTYSKISSGKHTVTVEKSGYTKYTELVNVKADKTATVKAQLSRISSDAAPELSATDYLNLGRDAAADKKLDLAIEDFDKAIAISPGMADAYIERGKIYAVKGEGAKAADDYIRAGEILRINNKLTQAADAFSTALGYSPKNINAIVGRAGVSLDQGDFRPGLKDYETALDIDKKFYPALFGAGVCQFKLGENKKAEKYFNKAHEVNSSDPYLYQYMMLNYLARDDFNNMKKMYSEFKLVANSAELAAFKSSSRFEPVMRLINEEDR
ncbi:MAG: tetratricopeptide repeat protein [Candidatus Zixiibacteriota bacterium]